MDKRNIGPLKVSIVGIGCNNFGMRIDEAQTKVVVDAAIEAGINFFDTADIYGGTKSEEFLGRALGSHRKDVLVATKFGHKVEDGKEGARPEYLKQACEDSLKRLGTDYIDLYQLHTPDATVPIAETLGAMDELVTAGKVLHIGCSNLTPAMLDEAFAATEPGAAKFISLQNEFSLLKREPENGDLAACDKYSLGFLPYFPIASGLLSGKYRKGQPLPEGTRINAESRWYTEESLDKVEKLIAFAESKGHTILELAFGWLLAHQQVSSVIAGATKAEQVRANAQAASWVLTPDEKEEARRIAAG